MTQNERLIFLIEYLLNESERYRDIDIPSDITEQKNLFRSLVNIRTPKAISDDFIKIQDEYLQGEIAEKGITDANTLPFAENKISLWQGDITTLKCGAIVNAANSALLGCFVPCHKCIDNAIHTFSGVELRLENYGKAGFCGANGQGENHKIIQFALRLYFAHGRSDCKRSADRKTLHSACVVLSFVFGFGRAVRNKISRLSVHIYR